MATTTYETPSEEPDKIVVGRTTKWTKSLSDFLPENGWTLKYVLVRKDTAPIELAGSDNGDSTHLTSIAVADSEDWSPGEYAWQSYVEDTPVTERYDIGAGLVEIVSAFQYQTEGFDHRSHVKQVLDALEATIQNKASKDQLSYSISGRTLSRMAPSELIEWRNHYLSAYRQELKEMRREQGKGSSTKIRARFVSSGGGRQTRPWPWS